MFSELEFAVLKDYNCI